MSAIVLQPLALLLILREVMRGQKKSDFTIQLIFSETHRVSANPFFNIK
jgi:hypothetical protein